jgi:hypothetical protein
MVILLSRPTRDTFRLPPGPLRIRDGPVPLWATIGCRSTIQSHAIDNDKSKRYRRAIQLGRRSVQSQPQSALIGYVITAIIISLVLFLRFRSMKRARPLNLGMLWLVPALYTLVTVGVLYQTVPQGMQWLYIALALAVGGMIGWRRGALMRISVDPETHALNQQASPAAMLFILAIIIVRQGLRAEASQMGFNAAFLAELLVVFALGLFSATRLEMFLRARRLLAEARAA